MTEREKIIELAKKCGIAIFNSGEVDCTFNELKSFYHAAQADAFEQAAKLCEYIPVGCGLEGRTFADAIRQLGKESK